MATRRSASRRPIASSESRGMFSILPRGERVTNTYSRDAGDGKTG
jgi:hypothetical protein